MSHMVMYRSVEGQPVYHQVENLEDAARHVETLRNGGQGDDARIFRLEEVKIEVKTYYRVEVATVEPAASPASAPVPAPAQPAAAVAAEVPAQAVAAAPVAAAPVAPAAAAPAPVKPEPEPAVAGAGAGAAGANGGRFGLFGKS